VIHESAKRILWAVFLLLLGAVPAATDLRSEVSGRFEVRADSLCLAGDSGGLDSLVATAKFSAYRFLREEIERYFDSGDERVLRTVNCVASAISREYGDSFYVRQAHKYRDWSQSLRERRSEAKQRFGEVVSGLGEGVGDSLAVSFESIGGQFLGLGDSTAAVRALQYAGSILSQPADDRHAMRVLTQSLAIGRAVGDLDGVARSLNLIGGAYQRSGYSTKAGAYFDSARVIRTALHDDRGLADCLSNISTVYLSLDQLPESHRFAEEALRIRRQIGDTLQICQSLFDMMSAFRHQRPPEEVAGWLKEARTLVRGLSNGLLSARLLQSQGMLAEDSGEIDSAVAFYDSALAMPAVTGNARLAVSILTDLAVMYSRQGDYDAALKCHVRALDRSQKGGNQAGLAAVLHNIGTVYQQLGDVTTAVEYFERSLEIRRRLSVLNETVETLNSLGEIYATVNDPATASEYYRQAADVARIYGSPRLLANSLIAQAQLDQQRQDHGNAMAKLDSARAIYESQSDAQRVFDVELISADYARRGGDWDRAEEQLASAKRILQSYDSYSNLQRYEICEGLLRFDRGQIDSAYSYLVRVVGRLERSRRSIPDLELRTFQKGSNRYLYEKLIAILAFRYEQSRRPALLDSLVRYIELAKSRSLLESLDRSHGDAVSRTPTGSEKRERTLLTEIEQAESQFSDSLPATERNSLRNRIKSLEGALADVRLRQSTVDPRNEMLIRSQPPPISQLQSRLIGDHSAVLDYLLTPDRSYLVVVTRDSLHLHELPARSLITEQFAEYSSLLQRSAKEESLIDSLRQAARSLTGTVFGLFADELPRHDRLYISADGALSLLPFETLIWDDKYVIECCEILYIPALEFLSAGHDRPMPAQPRLLLIADPTPSDKLRPLPYSLQEAQWISELFSSDHCRTLTGRDAVRSVLLSPEMSKYDVIHFATHSTMNQDDPLRSRIWLSPDTTADSGGYLSLYDVTQLSLPADLVVLSSCESGGGRFLLGEGIEGFVRGFMSAGCGNVIVSLWDVEDFASAVFMKEFYRNLQLGYAVALRRAKLSMIGSPRFRLRHPFYWAPFVLVKGS